MPFYKKLLIGLAVVVVVGCVVAGAVFYFTRGISDAASDFFATIAKSGPAAAYGEASPAFQQATSEAAFETIVKRVGLGRFESASWPTREINNGRGKVVGTLTLAGDIILPVTVQLAKNKEGKWQVFNFDITPPGAGFGNPQESRQPNPPAQQSQPAQSNQPNPPRKIELSAVASDGVSARIGDKLWMSSGSNMIAIELGDLVLVQTAPVVRSGNIDDTTLKLQFDGTSTKPQTLGRECQTNRPCIELESDGHQFLIDRNAKEPATLQITKVDSGSVEGTFSADMESLDGKASIQDGHFHITLNQKQK